MTPYQRRKFFGNRHPLAVTVHPLAEAMSKLGQKALYFLPGCSATWLKPMQRIAVWL